jgi:hypothetical protein
MPDTERMPVLLRIYESSDSKVEKEEQRPSNRQQYQCTSESEDSKSEQEDGMPKLTRRRYRHVGETDCSSEDEEQQPRRRRRRKKKRSNGWPGLNPLTLASGERINSKNKRQLRRENKAKRIQLQAEHKEQGYCGPHIEANLASRSRKKV